MPSRFGVKDALMILAMLALATVVGLSMVQADRVFARTLELESRIDDLQNRLAEMRTPSSVRTDDAAWWREGVPIIEPARAIDPDARALHAGGELVEVLEGVPRTVTPYVCTDSFAERVLEGRITQSLGDFDPDTTAMRGVLASAWQVDPNGLWLRVKIDDRALFSDGMPVTARDVVYTFDRVLMNPLVNAPRFRDVFSGIQSVRKITERSVEFAFGEPMFNNVTLALRFPILPAHVYERLTPEQINASTALAQGSGPYKLRDAGWTPGSGTGIVLVRNENYWGPRPSFDRIRFRVLTGRAARLTAFTNGEAHIVRPSPSQFEAISAGDERAGRAVSWQTFSSGYTYIAWRCGERDGALTPFHDARVRRAMTMLLDRGRILRDFYRGLGSVSTGPFSPVTAQADPSISPHPYDLDGARALLAEAGWRDRDGDGFLENPEGVPFSFEFSYPRGSSSSPKVAAYLRDQCARVGIRMTERVLDFAVFIEARQAGDFDAITLAQGVGFPESDPYSAWHSESEGNFTGWTVADALIERGRRTMDEQSRMLIWHELHRAIHEAQPCTFLIDRAQLRLISDALLGVRTTAVGLDLSGAFFAPGLDER